MQKSAGSPNIYAKWSPQNVYIIDGKQLSRDGFVKQIIYGRTPITGHHPNWPHRGKPMIMSL
jgi:hypothetical protein